jgi:rhamnosyltransferase
VPFRDVAYAEDRALAVDMLRAGYAKAYVPGAPVLHSHDYPPFAYLRRCFDEWQGLHEVYGWREPVSPAHLLAQLRGGIGHAHRDPVLRDAPAMSRVRALVEVAGHHAVRLTGAILGSRADRLPRRARRALSLERHAGAHEVGEQAAVSR